jgi:hypothetical protein
MWIEDVCLDELGVECIAVLEEIEADFVEISAQVCGV